MKDQKFLSLFLFFTLSFLSVFSSLATLSPVSAQQDKLPVYVVQSGDTLSSIALKFNLSTNELIQANSLLDPNLLKIGDQIAIPGLNGISGTLVNYLVPFGKNLLTVCREYQVNKKAIVTLNKLTSPSELFAGRNVIIPKSEDSESFIPKQFINTEQTLLEFSVLNDTSVWKLNQINGISLEKITSNESIYLNGSRDQNLQQPLPYIQEIEIANFPLTQGDTFEIIIKSVIPLKISGKFSESNLIFNSESENRYYAIQGISAVMEAGAYPLSLVLDDLNGSQKSYEQWVLVKQGGYINDPEIYVPAESVNPDNIANEEILLQEVISNNSPNRYWEGIFSAPVGDRDCVTGYYGNRRSYNDGALLYYHTGIDFGYCTGTEVYAPANGIVVATEENLIIRGNALIIDHGWGIYTGYWHLNQFLVQVGDKVEKGQLIAILGNTGRSAAPHLHFEMIVNGIPVNPNTWLDREFP